MFTIKIINTENRIRNKQSEILYYGKKIVHFYFADCEALGVLNAM